MEKRLIDIETRLIFQEDNIDTLSDLLTNQQTQIDALSRRVDNMATLIEKLIDEDGS